MTNQAYKLKTDNSPFGQCAVVAIDKCNVTYVLDVEADVFVNVHDADITAIESLVDDCFFDLLEIVNENIDVYWSEIKG